MRYLDWTNISDPKQDSKIILRAGAIALVVEFVALTLFGLKLHWISHPPKTVENTKYIEAEVFKMPKIEHLVTEKPIAAPQHEVVLNKVPNRGKTSKTPPKFNEENQARSGPPLAPTHGPIALYAPPPTIPSYLRDQDLSASAVIDFYVGSDGSVSPHLVGSTGNEELDAVAIDAVKKWRFRPAEQNHRAIASKIRLRIIFQVH